MGSITVGSTGLSLGEKMGQLGVFVIFLASLCGVFGLENGLARTPPMGWLSWERFRCNTDCENDPEYCIGERLFREMSDMMAVGGYLEAGYDTIIIDDCWLDHKRSADGKLQADPKRFASGIPSLSDYIHKLGLKFGIYEDYGNFTCGGYPGILGHMETDAKTFAEWNVDYVKLDGCYSDPTTMETGYPDFGRYLNETKRPMVYSCSWPAYQIDQHPDYESIAEHCNLWRNFDDITDSWDSVLSIIDWYGDDKDGFSKFAGPGQWNDPDMLIIGNYGLSLDQSKAQMGMWCMFASPLIMSADLRSIRPEFKEIMLNRNVIKLNQDPMGIQAKRIIKGKEIDVYSRPVMPVYKGKTSVAVAFLNRWNEGTPLKVKFTLKDLGLDHPGGYQAFEIFTGKKLGSYKPGDSFSGSVNPTGILLVRFNVMAKASGYKEVTSSASIGEGIDITYPGLTGWKTEF